MSKWYIEFDDFGIKEIRCMNCLETVVAQRGLVTVSGKEIAMLKKNSSWNQKIVRLENKGRKTYVEPILCSECIKENIDTKELIKQIKYGVKQSLKFNKRTDLEIDDAINEFYDLTEITKTKEAKEI